MKVAFRVDSSVQVGAGHLMRCLSLADALQERGAEIRFVCREAPGSLAGLLQARGQVLALLAPAANETEVQDLQQTDQALADFRPDWLVLDHYGLGVAWEEAARTLGGRLLVIDDLPARRHDCDLLLDQNYSAAGDDRYAGWVPSGCGLLLGPRFALLHSEFRTLRQALAVSKSRIGRLLIFFTMGQDQGETLKAMAGVAMHGGVQQVDVVVGVANADRAVIDDQCQARGWGYHCQINYMPRLIAQADLALGAGGSSNWERCALGVPAIVSVLAENQAAIAADLAQAGVVDNLGWSTKLQLQHYAEALDRMTPGRLEAMSSRAMALVDAQGAPRVAGMMLE